MRSAWRGPTLLSVAMASRSPRPSRRRLSASRQRPVPILTGYVVSGVRIRIVRLTRAFYSFVTASYNPMIAVATAAGVRPVVST